MTLAVGCVPNKFQFEKDFGKSGSAPGQFLSPTDLDINSKGNLVIADSGNTRVQVVTTDGAFVMAVGESGHDGYKLQSIVGIGVNPLTDDILVCDQRGSKIVRFNSSGRPDLRIMSKVKHPMDVAVDKQGNIYVVMTKKAEIYKYDDRGTFTAMVGGSGKSALVFPTSIVISNEHIYVTDYGAKRIVKLSMSGQFISEFKAKGEYEEIKGPSRIHLDNKGNMYLLDLGEVPVVILSPEGNLVSKLGDFGNQTGNFLYPTGVIAKSPEEIFVLDNSRNKVLNFKNKPE